MSRVRKRRLPPERPPFTADEDQRLRDAIGCGLCSSFWHLALPGRVFGELTERALVLGIERRPLI